MTEAMDFKAIQKHLGKDWTDVESLIRSSLGSDIDLLNKTNDAILSNSGKELRPMLCLLVARACSKDGKTTFDSICFAAASELIHNATLLHDDVVDGSKERRGAPTVMSVLGGSASVLIGDFWLVKAMETVMRVRNLNDVAVRPFTKTLGDLAEGEILQLQKAGSGDTTEEDYLRIIYSKTASLFETASVSAAMSVDASDEVTEAVREYAADIGIAFQIRDDMLDYSDGAVIGKPVGMDLDEQKITLPLLGALKNIGPEKAREVRQMILNIREHPEHKEEITSLVRTNGGLEYAASVLDSYVDKACKALDLLPETADKDYLLQVAQYMAQRDR